MGKPGSASASRDVSEAADGDAEIEIVVPRAAWVFAYAGAAVPCLILVVAASTPGGDFFALLPALMLGALVALTWTVGFVVAVAKRLRPGRATCVRWLGIPLIGVLAFALTCSPVPLWARFQASRSAFEDAVARIQAGQSVEPGWIGLYDVSGAFLQDGNVWFAIDACYLNRCGFVFVPGDPPSGSSPDLAGHVDGPWWQWIDYW